MTFGEYQSVQQRLSREHKERCAASAARYNQERADLDLTYSAHKLLRTYIEIRKRYPAPGLALNRVHLSQFAALKRMCEMDPRFAFNADTGTVSNSVTK